MHLCYLSSSKLDSGRANAVHVVKMCSAISSLGHQVTLIVYKAARKVDIRHEFGVESPVRILEIQPTGFGWARHISLLRAFIATIRTLTAVDLWYTRNLHAAMALAILRKPFYYELHDIHSNPIARLLIKKLLASKIASRIIVITNELRNDVLRTYPNIKDSKLIVAPDGADDVNPDRSEESPDEKVFKVGYVGSFSSGKGMEIVSSIANALRDERDIVFHVVGGDDASRKVWQERTTGTNIVWHGYVPHARALQIMRQLDVGLLPNQRKVTLEENRGDIGRWTSPLKLFEYMASGSAIVASDLPVIREILKDGENSLLCPPEDTGKWLEAVRSLKENPTLRVRIARSGRKELIEKYTWKRRAAKILGESA
jgi:glycosyltransferase involved in cell wall biosynthesis